jgi:hypothetical protein
VRFLHSLTLPAIMKNILKIIFIIFPVLIFSQVKVLENIDFLNNDYKLIFIQQREDGALLVSEPSKSFLISNKKKLIELQNTWIGEETEDILLCGYDYYIYIVDKDSILGKLNVNISCGQVVAYGIGKTCNFNVNPFKDLKKDKKIFMKYLIADTVTKARKLYDKIITSRGIYYPDKKYSQWINYEGKAYISIKAKGNTLKSHTEIRKDFDKKYSIVNQYIDFWGFSKEEYSGWIYCSEDFLKKIIQEGFEWSDYNVFIKENSWETWEKNGKKFGAFIFSEKAELFDNLKK